MSDNAKKPFPVTPPPSTTPTRADLDRAIEQEEVDPEVLFARLHKQEIENLVGIRTIAYRLGWDFEELLEASQTMFERQFN